MEWLTGLQFYGYRLPAPANFACAASISAMPHFPFPAHRGLGYAFLQEKDPSSAVVLFKLNTKAYPDSANAWDSLGDGYEATNDIQDARMAYARSVELNPDNEHAKGELVKLRK